MSIATTLMIAIQRSRWNMVSICLWTERSVSWS